MNSSITLLIHIYYPGSWEVIKKKCGFAISSAARVIVTTCHDDVIAEIGTAANLSILKVTNKGKDIGGKLAALFYYMEYCAKTDYLAFLHDKVSPQTINAEYWLEQLYSIFREDLFNKALKKMGKNRHIGIIGSKTFLNNEYRRVNREFETTNNELLLELMGKYGISCPQYNFIAGTIFIARSRIYEEFFSRYSPFEAREKLETGNVLDLDQGTYTHSWERVLSFIAESKGYTIKGM
jgi:hypothetical protein